MILSDHSLTRTTIRNSLTHPTYRPDIDGLRAIAVLSVVIFHAFPSAMGGGFTGVDVFFVISGFLISTIIFENLDKGTFSFTEFYARRIRRIFPALLVVLAACYALGWFVLLADEYQQLGKHIAGGAGFVSNFILWSEAGYFDNSSDTKPLLHLWSLGIEEQFYILWPLLIWCAWKQRLNLLTLTVVMAIVSFGLNVRGIRPDPVATFYSPQTRFWELLCGSLLAWLTLYKPQAIQTGTAKIGGWLSTIVYREKPENEAQTLANFLSIVGLGLLAYGFWGINKEFRFPGRWALVPVLGAVCIIAAGPRAWINRTILSNKVLVWFGLISFPLYLWHWPLLSFARIVEGGVPSVDTRIAAIVLAIMLSWLTFEFIEKPVRFRGPNLRAMIFALCGFALALGVAGFKTSKTDYSNSNSDVKLAAARKRSLIAEGVSLRWYRGKEDWLFLGNAYDQTVAKLKLAISPTEHEIAQTKGLFASVAQAGLVTNTKIALFLGPNKESIYPEYLPDDLVPSEKRYSSLFLNELVGIPNLAVYDPTEDLQHAKKSEGILYWRTDTHWNHKGAFLAYAGFSRVLGLPIPSVTFQQGSIHRGDLIGISKLETFPVHPGDNWEVIWKNKPMVVENKIEGEQKTIFGQATIVTNQAPLTNKRIWIVGDSFAVSLRQYFNATFAEVRYIGHWSQKLKELASELVKAERKPDVIVIIRVERSF